MDEAITQDLYDRAQKLIAHPKTPPEQKAAAQRIVSTWDGAQRNMASSETGPMTGIPRPNQFVKDLTGPPERSAADEATGGHTLIPEGQFNASHSKKYQTPPRVDVPGQDEMVFTEPSVEQFHAAAPKLYPNADPLERASWSDPESNQYREYADAMHEQWAQGAARGKTQVRPAYLGTLGGRIAEKAARFAKAAVPQFIDTSLFTLPTRMSPPAARDEFKKAQEASPAGSLAGQAAAYLNPWNPLNVGAAKAMGAGLHSTATGLLGSTIGGVAEGAAIGAGIGTADQAIRDTVYQNTLAPDEKPLSPLERWSRPAKAGLAAGGAGAVIGGLAGAARAASAGIHENIPQIDASGGKSSVLSGFVEGPEVAAARAASKNQPLDAIDPLVASNLPPLALGKSSPAVSTTPQQMLAKKLAPTSAKNAHTMLYGDETRPGVFKALSDETASYLASHPEAQTVAKPINTFQGTVKEIDRLWPQGQERPGPLVESLGSGQIRALQKSVGGQIKEARLVPANDKADMLSTRAEGPGGGDAVWTIAEAQKYAPKQAKGAMVDKLAELIDARDAALNNLRDITAKLDAQQAAQAVPYERVLNEKIAAENAARAKYEAVVAKAEAANRGRPNIPPTPVEPPDGPIPDTLAALEADDAINAWSQAQNQRAAAQNAYVKWFNDKLRVEGGVVEARKALQVKQHMRSSWEEGSKPAVDRGPRLAAESKANQAERQVEAFDPNNYKVRVFVREVTPAQLLADQRVLYEATRSASGKMDPTEHLTNLEPKIASDRKNFPVLDDIMRRHSKSIYDAKSLYEFGGHGQPGSEPYPPRPATIENVQRQIESHGATRGRPGDATLSKQRLDANVRLTSDSPDLARINQLNASDYMDSLSLFGQPHFTTHLSGAFNAKWPAIQTHLDPMLAMIGSRGVGTPGSRGDMGVVGKYLGNPLHLGSGRHARAIGRATETDDEQRRDVTGLTAQEREKLRTP